MEQRAESEKQKKNIGLIGPAGAEVSSGFARRGGDASPINRRMVHDWK